MARSTTKKGRRVDAESQRRCARPRDVDGVAIAGERLAQLVARQADLDGEALRASRGREISSPSVEVGRQHDALPASPPARPCATARCTDAVRVEHAARRARDVEAEGECRPVGDRRLRSIPRPASRAPRRGFIPLLCAGRSSAPSCSRLAGAPAMSSKLGHMTVGLVAVLTVGGQRGLEAALADVAPRTAMSDQISTFSGTPPTLARRRSRAASSASVPTSAAGPPSRSPSARSSARGAGTTRSSGPRTTGHSPAG